MIIKSVLAEIDMKLGFMAKQHSNRKPFKLSDKIPCSVRSVEGKIVFYFPTNNDPDAISLQQSKMKV